jgi:hypothetical protein
MPLEPSVSKRSNHQRDKKCEIPKRKYRLITQDKDNEIIEKNDEI